MFRQLSQQEIQKVKPLLDREDNFIMYNNLHLKQDRSFLVGDFHQDQFHAFGCYLTGLPFHAFALHVASDRPSYQAGELLNVITSDLHLSGKGYLTVAEHVAAKLDLDGVQSTQTMLLMKLTDPAKLLPSQAVTKLTGNDLDVVNQFVHRVGMMAFRKEELDKLPHVGIYEEGKLVSIAGFHIFEDQYAEIGNIGTLPEQQGKGLAKRVTSEICRVGLEKTSDVYLMVFEHNQPAIRVYETLGFATILRYSYIQFEL